MPLQEMWTRLEGLSDRVSGLELRTERQFWDLRHRVASLEQRVSRRRGRTSEVLGFLGQVATVKTWIVGGILVVLALKGTFSAGEWKAIFLALIGAGSAE